MTSPLFVIALPLLYDYSSFFEIAISKLSRSTKSLDVIIISTIENSSELNIALLSSYTQLRKKLVDSGFAYDFDINVYVNKKLKTEISNYQVFYVESEGVQISVNGFNGIAIHLAPSPILLDCKNTTEPVHYRSVDTVAVGGTFDHLHDGHKILLLMTAFAAKAKLIIGITGPLLLQNKKYSSMLEPLDLRIKKTCNFLRKVLHSGQRYEVYQINDVCGPTGFISGIDSLIISEETILGATFVNSYRSGAGFLPLNIICVDVIGGDGTSDNGWSGKLSSTELRRLELDKRDKQ